MPRSIPTYRLYGEAGSQDADFWLHFEELPVRSRPYRWEIDSHRHEAYFQIFAILKGGGELLGGAAPERFEAPAALVVPAGAAHGFRFSPDSDGSVLTILADRLHEVARADRRFAGFYAVPRIVPLSPERPETARARAGLALIREELGSRRAGRMVLAGALIVDVLVHLARSAASDTPERLWGSAGPDAGRLERLTDLIDTHFREHQPVAFYASRIGISATHLNRLARTHLGASVQRLLDRKLTSEARRQLVFTAAPAKAIAFSLGFSDPGYFSRFFRKQTGRTPGAYRAAKGSRSAG